MPHRPARLVRALALLVLAIWAVPVKAATLTVNTGDNLQAALDRAVPGDTILLQAGATFTGNYILTNKTGIGWITVRTSAADNLLPLAGARITPAYAWLLPKIVSPNADPAITGALGAHHFLFLGVEIATTWTDQINTNYGLVLFSYDANGQSATSVSVLPHDLTFDRCYLHGTPTGNVRRGIVLNAANVRVVNSYLSDFHEVGADSQALAGWNGPGPFTITNNYLEAAGENVMFGGSDAAIPNLTPSDITLTGNTFTKRLSWRVGDPTYAGVHWSVKNLLELKHAQRVLIDGNLFEYNWADGQSGWAVVINPINQDGANPWATVNTVTFTNNIVRHTGSGMLLNASGLAHPAHDITVRNNLFYDMNKDVWGGDYWVLLVQNGITAMTFDHNTIDSPNPDVLFFYGAAKQTNFVYTNNLARHNDYGVIGDGVGSGTAALSAYTSGYTFLNNVLAVSSTPPAYPPTTLFPSAAAFDANFVDKGAANYRLVASSPYKNAGTDGTDIGVNMDALPSAAPAPAPVPTPTPAPVPAPKTCLDQDGEAYAAGQAVIVATTKVQQKTVTSWYTGHAWLGPELINKRLKTSVDLTFRCGA